MGKIAGCLKKDPNCPRSPNLAKLAVDMAKQGKGLGEILAAIDEKQKPVAPSGGGGAPAGGSKKVVPLSHDLRRGAKATKVTIVEFSDFQCPFCKRSEPTVKSVLDKYGKDIALVWMNQPLPFHDHAMDAATAFQAAARQGADKAWKLHDKMYENNTALTRADIEKYAGEVGPERRQAEEGLGRPEDQGRDHAGSEGGDRRGRHGHARRSSSTAASWSARRRLRPSRRSSTTR